MLIQPKAIDVTNWNLDDQFGSYPEGARVKSAFFPPENVGFDFINEQKRYLYKRSRNAYPDQFWAEIVAYQIGCILGVEVPPAFASYNTKDRTCGALIEWFYIDKEVRYVQGGNYMQMIIPKYDRRTGREHNFHSIEALSKAITRVSRITFKKEWLYYWGEVILFDALIGNTDRHQDNWGMVYQLENIDNLVGVSFSPAFDNGTSLGYERFPERVNGWSDDRFRQYVQRGYHHMRWKRSDSDQPNHIELVELLVKKHEKLHTYLYNLINSFDLGQLANRLLVLEELDLPIKLTRDRSNLYLKLVSIRHEMLCKALK